MQTLPVNLGCERYGTVHQPGLRSLYTRESNFREALIRASQCEYPFLIRPFIVFTVSTRISKIVPALANYDGQLRRRIIRDS